jgi:hypothetical protein
MNGKTKLLMPAVLVALVLIGTGLAASAGPDDRLDAEGIASASGARATTTPDGVVRIAWPRTDVPVKVDGHPLKPFAGLGSWATFTKAPHGAMVMGDTVVFQDEVNPAIDAAFAAGLEVTGLHNHFFYDEPKVYFMHIGGRGEPEKLAAGVRKSGPKRRRPPSPSMAWARSPARSRRGRSRRSSARRRRCRTAWSR